MGQLNDLFSPIGFIFIPGLNILWSVTWCIVSLAASLEVMRLCYSGYSTGNMPRVSEGHSPFMKPLRTVQDYQSTVDNNSSVANKLVSVRRKQVDENRQYVRYLMEALLYCGQQGIAIHGNRELEEAKSSINVGNYLNLLKLQSRHTEVLRKRLECGPKNASLLGHDYQNSMLQVLTESVLDYIRDEVTVTTPSSSTKPKTSVRKSK